MAKEITLSPSRIKRWVRCKRSYYWRDSRKLVRVHKEAPLSLGLLVSEVLAGYYRKPVNERNEDALGLLLRSSINKGAPKPTEDKKIVDEWGKAVKIATRILEPYHKWASPKDDFEVVHVETTQEIQLSPSVSLLAIPDTVVAVSPEVYMILEHKVRSRYHTGDFGIDYQSVGSCLVSGSIGTMYNVFEYRRIKNYRDIIVRSQYELDYFRSMFIEIGEDILSSSTGHMYPMPMKRCSCEYWELCNGEMQGVDLDDIISELYISTRAKRNVPQEKNEEVEGGD